MKLLPLPREKRRLLEPLGRAADEKVSGNSTEGVFSGRNGLCLVKC